MTAVSIMVAAVKAEGRSADNGKAQDLHALGIAVAIAAAGVRIYNPTKPT